MNGHSFRLCGAALEARPSGALWWDDPALLCVSDLHLGKSERMARNGGAMLPPYETRDTLARLDAEISATDPRIVVCLGDSFDDLTAVAALGNDERQWLARLQAGREWIWIEGNHDPGPVGLGGTHRAEHHLNGLCFRHIADPSASGEVSGHFHPKARLVAQGRMISRPSFLADTRRVIMPAFGTYTGGLDWADAAFAGLLEDGAHAFLTGARVTPLPIPKRETAG